MRYGLESVRLLCSLRLLLYVRACYQVEFLKKKKTMNNAVLITNDQIENPNELMPQLVQGEWVKNVNNVEGRFVGVNPWHNTVSIAWANIATEERFVALCQSFNNRMEELKGSVNYHH